MTGSVFVDTNVFVYVVDRANPEKRRQAAAALRSVRGEGLVVSPQVLQEFYVTVTRKLAHPLSHEMASREVAKLCILDVATTDAALVLSAIDLRERVGISLWDALILRAASSAGCERVLTEDLNHGQVIDGVRIEDPFRPSPRQVTRRR